MRKKQLVRDFNYYIDEYMYNCRSRKLRPKTMQSYEQTLRLFERWCLEEASITEPGQVLDSTIRHYICSLQERGKYTFYAVENCAITYDPARRRDFSHAVSTTTQKTRKTLRPALKPYGYFFTPSGKHKGCSGIIQIGAE